MKKWKKILLYLFIIGIVIGGIVFYKVTKRPATAADSEPVKEMVATELINELINHRQLIDSIYKDNNIAVKGKIIDIKDATIFIEGGPSATINCSFDSTTFACCKSTFKIGGEANIKGIYSGSDGFDVVVNPDDMLADVAGKNVMLKTCAPNKH